MKTRAKARVPDEDQRLLRPDLRPSPSLLGDERLGGDVTRRTEVLLQRQVDQTVDEVHAPEVAADGG